LRGLLLRGGKGKGRSERRKERGKREAVADA